MIACYKGHFKIAKWDPTVFVFVVVSVFVFVFVFLSVSVFDIWPCPLRQVPDWHWSRCEPEVSEGKHCLARLCRVRQLRDNEASDWVGGQVRFSDKYSGQYSQIFGVGEKSSVSYRNVKLCHLTIIMVKTHFQTVNWKTFWISTFRLARKELATVFAILSQAFCLLGRVAHCQSYAHVSDKQTHSSVLSTTINIQLWLTCIENISLQL